MSKHIKNVKRIWIPLTDVVTDDELNTCTLFEKNKRK